MEKFLGGIHKYTLMRGEKPDESIEERHIDWSDKVSGLYNLFEDVYNGQVYRGIGKVVANEIESDDEVLECACGTGAISIKCRVQLR
ncbi:MAG: hypothetical protein IJ661_01755 [Lachnospiraceae bacterium]|nr:hypothetical protein [Lachnospiraceae bacterium]